jgi:hypothetical protein
VLPPTPIANTIGARVPVVGVIAACLDVESSGGTRDDVLGPPIGYLMGRYAIGGRPLHVHRGLPPCFVFRAAPMFLRWWLRGLARPSPFFDPHRGTPCVEPLVLAADQRAPLDGQPHPERLDQSLGLPHFARTSLHLRY